MRPFAVSGSRRLGLRHPATLLSFHSASPSCSGSLSPPTMSRCKKSLLPLGCHLPPMPPLGPGAQDAAGTGPGHAWRGRGGAAVESELQASLPPPHPHPAMLSASLHVLGSSLGSSRLTVYCFPSGTDFRAQGHGWYGRAVTSKETGL